MACPSSRCVAALAALVLAASACAQVQDFQSPSDPPLAAAAAASPPSQKLDPVCGSVDDPASCGACGHSCMGGACSAGVCQPVILAEGQGLSVEPYYAGPRAIVTDETHVYWVTKPGLFRVSIAGGVPEKLADASVVSTYATNSDDSTNLIVLHGSHVYLRSADRTRIVRVPKTGGASLVTPVTPVADAEWTVGEMRFHGDQLVWMEQSFIRRHVLWTCASLPCDATERHEAWDADAVIDGLTLWPETFASDGANLCVSFASTKEVSGDYGVVCLAGGKKRFASGTSPVGSLVAAGHAGADIVTVYGSSGGMVFRTVIGTTIASPFLPDTVLASGGAAPRSAPLLDSGYLYWLGSPPAATDAALGPANVVWRVDESGRALPEPVRTGKPMIALAVTKDALYFGTSDGEVAKLAKPLARTQEALP